MDIYRTDAQFTVICKRCESKFEVARNWGGGIRRAEWSTHTQHLNNPAQCQCGSRQLEVY